MNTTTRKDAAVSFLHLVTQGKIREAYDSFVTPSFFHHNPHFKGDAESYAKGMEENHKQFPNKIYEVKHALEDGDIVAVHGHVRLVEGGKQAALVHIFRFENDKIAEMWDIGEDISNDSPNENGMF